jgi:glycosyltransferase involved in cell wall biosynthesis
MKILHIAPYNISGVPLAFVKAERELGHYSRMATFSRDWRGYEEDICLNLPGWGQNAVKNIRKVFYPPEKIKQSNREAGPGPVPPVWRPENIWSAVFLRMRDAWLRPLVRRSIRDYGLDDFDVYQLDGGHGFFKFNDIIPGWHRSGKKVICCYYGSDLRKRGVMPEIDAVSDCNVTVEWDHLGLHPKIHHVPYPFDCGRFDIRKYDPEKPGQKVVIGHSPTNRQAKGSDLIIGAVERLSQKYPVELLLIENVSYRRNLELRARCDIGVDQLGDLGYGISALEWLALGIPVATCLAPQMVREVKDHPFVEINEASIEDRLGNLINDPLKRRELGMKGRKWLEEFHHSEKAVNQIHQLAGLK